MTAIHINASSVYEYDLHSYEFESFVNFALNINHLFNPVYTPVP